MWTIVGAVGSMGLALIGWGLKVGISALVDNTLQVKILNSHIETLLKLPPRVDKLEQDLKVAHDRIRTVYKNGG